MTEQTTAHTETSTLIASNKVEGTAVFNEDGDKLGKISNFMVNKQSGQVEYAVMSFGGFLGMGEDHYPLPWKMLNYVVSQEGYVVDIDKDMLDKAPRHQGGVYPNYDTEYGSSVSRYYDQAR